MADKRNIPIFYACDEGFIKYAAVSLHSMIVNASPDYHYSVFQRHPQWVEQSHQLGMKTNAWTVNDAATMQWCIDQGIDYITTNEPELLQNLLPASH